VHLEDPVAYWQAKAAEQQRLVDWLVGKERVEVRGEHVDLTLSIAGRTFVNARGDQNMPDGEIFTGPVEDSVEGWVRFTYPAIYHSREVEDVQLWFEAGRVVRASAGKGQAFLDGVLATDPGARYVGEFAIGTNEGLRHFTRDIFFDEKIGGTIHLALGAGYPETGSQNESSVHWDMICDMRSGGEIIVDGELFYKDGEFKV
jgi:aminopeptidase